jgi:hypothetical protein
MISACIKECYCYTKMLFVSLESSTIARLATHCDNLDMPGPTGIGERVGVTRETVNKILKHNRETDNLNPGRSTEGPITSTARDGRQLLRLARQDRLKSGSTLVGQTSKCQLFPANREWKIVPDGIKGSPLCH